MNNAENNYINDTAAFVEMMVSEKMLQLITLKKGLI